jgi:hypothetical protein
MAGFVKLKIYWYTRKQGCAGDSRRKGGQGGVGVRATTNLRETKLLKMTNIFRECNWQVGSAMVSVAVSSY